MRKRVVMSIIGTLAMCCLMSCGKTSDTMEKEVAELAELSDDMNALEMFEQANELFNGEETEGMEFVTKKIQYSKDNILSVVYAEEDELIMNLPKHLEEVFLTRDGNDITIPSTWELEQTKQFDGEITIPLIDRQDGYMSMHIQAPITKETLKDNLEHSRDSVALYDVGDGMLAAVNYHEEMVEDWHFSEPMIRYSGEIDFLENGLCDAAVIANSIFEIEDVKAEVLIGLPLKDDVETIVEYLGVPSIGSVYVYCAEENEGNHIAELVYVYIYEGYEIIVTFTKKINSIYSYDWERVKTEYRMTSKSTEQEIMYPVIENWYDAELFNLAEEKLSEVFLSDCKTYKNPTK